MYSQLGGDLQLKAEIEFAQPGTTYEVFLVCGPAHGLGCGFVTVGTITTNPLGAGVTGITVPFAVLVSAPFGPGYRTDHIDILRGVGDLSKGILTAGAINYFVCQREGHVGAEKAELKTEVRTTGDPFGAQVKEGSDPTGTKQKKKK